MRLLTGQAATREFALQSELGQSEGALSAMKIQLTASTQHREVAVRSIRCLHVR